MNRLLPIALLSLFATSTYAQDAAKTDGDKYKIMLENNCVRVLDYHDVPGDKTHQHTHPNFVLYALSAFKRSITLPDGKVLKREFKAGDVIWSPQQTHIGHNSGDTPTHVLIVELKQNSEGACSK